jgi:hypothetical protein
VNSNETNAIIKTHSSIATTGITQDSVFLNGAPIDILQGMQFVSPQFTQMVRNVQHSVRATSAKTLAEVNIIEALSTYNLIVPTIDKTILDQRAISLGIIHQTLPHQIEFLNFLFSINWTAIDDGVIGAFYILFSRDSDEIKAFHDFATHDHLVPSVFVLNPHISASLASLLNLDITKTVLIASGRVLKTCTIARLRLLDSLITVTHNRLSPILENLRENRDVVSFYINSVFADWFAERIRRLQITDDIWNRPSPLIRCTLGCLC